MNKILPVLLLFYIPSLLIAQTDTTNYWTKKGFFQLNASQIMLYRWVAGGTSSVNPTGIFHYEFNYKEEKSNWDNGIDIALGGIKQYFPEKTFIKNDDKIELSSQYGHFAFDNEWLYSVLLNFRTQSLAGIGPDGKDTISLFMAPAYITLAVGMDYKYVSTNKKFDFSALIAPLSGKFTIVNDQRLADIGAFGVKMAEYGATGQKIANGEKVRAEMGAFIRTSLIYKLMENITLNNKVDLFTNYLDKKSRGNIDVNWNLLLDMKINKYFTFNVGISLIYDDDIKTVPFDDDRDGTIEKTGVSAQIKQFSGLGFSYKF